jgi:2'-5' RNA ligase
MRLFLALPLPDDAARALEEATRRHVASPAAPPGDWRATPAERIHLTLKFLGEVDPARVPALSEALPGIARAAGGPIDAEAGGPGGWLLLPSPRDARVLAVRLSDPAGRLPSLAASVEGRTAALGFARERRPFLPHATVARLRRPARGRGRSPVPPPASEGGPPAMRLRLDRVVLMESVLGPGGPRYAAVATASL